MRFHLFILCYLGEINKEKKMQKIRSINLFFYFQILIVTKGSHLNSRNEEKLLRSKKLNRVLKFSIIFSALFTNYSKQAHPYDVSERYQKYYTTDENLVQRMGKFIIKFDLYIIFHGHKGIFIYDNKG